MNNIQSFPSFENKKILFLAETHYQLINCINIASHMCNAECDLYIRDFYKNTKCIAEKIKQFGIFNKVTVYDDNFSKFSKGLHFLLLKRYIDKIFVSFDYNVLFFATRDFLCKCLVTYAKYHKPSTKLISYDEGIGSYNSRMESYTNAMEKFLIKLLYGDKAEIITDKMLYEPHAYVGESQNIILYEMPIIDNFVLDKINYLYDFDEEKKINSRYIFFDEYFNSLDDLTNRVVETLDYKTNHQLVIKRHPQNLNSNYTGGKVYEYSNLPFEIVVANDENIEDKTLITTVSTAVWTPMLLFHKYPRIILLYPIFNVKLANDVIGKLISLYDETKVKIVNSIEELKELSLE